MPEDKDELVECEGCGQDFNPELIKLHEDSGLLLCLDCIEDYDSEEEGDQTE